MFSFTLAPVGRISGGYNSNCLSIKIQVTVVIVIIIILVTPAQFLQPQSMTKGITFVLRKKGLNPLFSKVSEAHIPVNNSRR
jgi:hypothetical protein